MTAVAEVRPCGDVVAGLGEGPLWHDGVLLWVDIPNGRLHRTDATTGATTSRELGAPLALVLAARDGSLLLARGDELLVLADPDAPPRAWLTFPHRENMRLNDGTWDSRGRLLVGTMVLPQHDGGPAGLWRIEPDGRPHEVAGDLRLSNGVAWSPDGRRLYHVDTPVRRIWVHETDAAGEFTAHRVLVEIEPGVGNPDGLTVDAAGDIWVAMFGGGALRRYDAHGTLAEQLALPVQHPTSCAFGGRDLATLFVTTASNRLDDAGRREQPLAGRLLTLRPGATGHPGVRGTAPERVPSSVT